MRRKDQSLETPKKQSKFELFKALLSTFEHFKALKFRMNAIGILHNKQRENLFLNIFFYNSVSSSSSLDMAQLIVHKNEKSPTGRFPLTSNNKLQFSIQNFNICLFFQRFTCSST